MALTDSPDNYVNMVPRMVSCDKYLIESCMYNVHVWNSACLNTRFLCVGFLASFVPYIHVCVLVYTGFVHAWTRKIAGIV